MGADRVKVRSRYTIGCTIGEDEESTGGFKGEKILEKIEGGPCARPLDRVELLYSRLRRLILQLSAVGGLSA